MYLYMIISTTDNTCDHDGAALEYDYSTCSCAVCSADWSLGQLTRQLEQRQQQWL